MLAAETFHVFGQDYTLQRYPSSNDNMLRAWDTADEYLLNTLQEQQIDLSEVCIINDNFGALTLPLASYEPLCYGDSWLSREALFENLKCNQLANKIHFSTSIEDFTDQANTPRYIIGRIPKSKRQLTYLLQHLNRWAKTDCTLLLAGMDKHLSRGQFDLLAQNFGPAKFYPGVKKARIWEAKVDKHLSLESINPSRIALPELALTLSALPNVFSQEKLDIGTRFFLEHFSRLPEHCRVADLACGNGVLGLAYLRHFPEASVLFCDESFQALASTRDNVARHFPDADVSVCADDGLKQCPPNSLQLILCNPPFHQQAVVSTQIACSLFKDAYRALEKTGEFWVIANRHLGYHIELKKHFNHCKTIASNSKFVLLKAVK